MDKARDINAKYAVSTDGKIYKKSNNEILPEDEPLFLLRGRDKLATKCLWYYYYAACETKGTEYILENFLDEVIASFESFKANHPDRMKIPGVTKGN